jgi:TATA-box binding protein (TBP) (component of TFIID and TFIIIB)
MDGGVTPPTIANVKIRFCLCVSVCKKLNKQIKFLEEQNKKRRAVLTVTRLSNFILFKRKSVVYTIFKNLENTYCKVNITGIKTLKKISKAIATFCFIFKIAVKDIESDIIVDNIFANGNFNKSINLHKLMRSVNGNKENKFKVNFNCDRGSGAYCRQKGVGTLGLFRNGKYIILGAKSKRDVFKLFYEIQTIINKL